MCGLGAGEGDQIGGATSQGCAFRIRIRARGGRDEGWGQGGAMGFCEKGIISRGIGEGVAMREAQVWGGGQYCPAP